MILDSIIFDFDGVLVETMDIKTQAFCDLYQEHGVDIVEKVKNYHLANGGVSRYEKFRYFAEVLLGEKISEDELNNLGERFSKLVEGAVIKASWVAGAHEFLEKFYTEISFYVVSATPTDELKRIIQARKMNHYFQSVHGSPKKKGALINKIVSENDYKHDRVVMIGDATSDYDGAKEAGVKFIGRVPDGQENIFPPDITVIKDILPLQQTINNCI